MRGLARRASIGVVAAAAVVVASLGASAASGAPRSASGSGKGLTSVPGSVKQDGPVLSAEVSAQVKAAQKEASRNGTTNIVVRLKDAPLASYKGGIAGLPATSPRVTGRKLDPSAPDSQKYLKHLDAQITGFVGRAKKKSPSTKVTQKLDVVVGGVALTVPTDDVAAIAADPAVAAVYPNRLEQPQTEVSPQFIGAATAWAQAGGQENAGENAIVGVIDSGIWPEHPSVADPDPAGKAFPAPRGTTNGSARACQFGSATPGDVPFTCNNKLIGAYRFMTTYQSIVGLDPGEFRSARDDDGHGTHTATTAAGDAGVAASIFGTPRGIVSGIAPRAHIIAYKVCGLQGCFSSDSAAAVQRAIIDDVDAINFSISGGSNPYNDAVSAAFLDAYNAGIFVAASAGNSGPGADTTDHREPWVTTVAASTGPRSFQGSATLSATGATPLTVSGTSIMPSITTATSIVDAGAAPFNDPFCISTGPASSFAGKIVLCQRGGGPGRVQKSFNVQSRGGVGMILFNNSTAVTDLETDNYFIPAIQVQFAEGQQIKAFIAANPDATATIAGGVATPAKGDVMASFSSRGGPGQSLGISKPDVTAPGVQILAGASPQHVDVAAGPNGELFQAIAGTSMSSPHVAGAGALLASLHPTWTPGQIHSALMTTAATKVVKEDGTTPTDAFDDGSGRVNLNQASDPYFTIDETGANYVSKQANLYTSNYPSLYVPALAGALTVSRTLKSVSSKDREFEVSVSSPKDLSVKVSPNEFTIRKGSSKTVTITVDGRAVPLGQTRFAVVTFKSGSKSFTFPVTIVRKQGPVEVTKTCDPASVKLGATTTCTVTMTNTLPTDAPVSLTDKLPSQLKLESGSVTGGTASSSTVRATTTIPAKLAPGATAAYGLVNPNGYVPLSTPSFGSAQVTAGDETITNFTVPAFTLAGLTYNRIGIVSDGYLVLGGGTAADVDFLNSDLPNPARPNNIVAPFWTDLNPGAGGKVWINVLSDGTNSWIIVEFEAVPEYSSAAKTHTFQVWIGIDGADDISAVYGAQNGNGDGGFATVGVENPDGTNGTALYYNGTGVLPADGDQFGVTGTPGQTFSATVTYQAKGSKTGSYVNYAEVTGPFDGTAIARFAGKVTK